MMRPNATIDRTPSVPLVMAERVPARVCPSAVGRQMSLNRQMDHLAVTLGGARMQGSRTSNCTTIIAHPQWRHTKVGGFASVWSGAASSAALAIVEWICTPSNCRAVARPSLRPPLDNNP